jgi:ADP-heptose:LPS heptosyltransferase
VALTVPVLQSLKTQYPELEITIVSRPFLKSLFEPLDVNFHAVNPDHYKGLLGLHKLYKELKKEYHPDKIIDLHYVIRTRIISLFFKLSGTPIFHLNKGRKDKKALTRKVDKVRKVLPHTTQRYSSVFEDAGYSLDFNPKSAVSLNFENTKTSILSDLASKKILIGIAPFAFHKAKMWPLSKMTQLIDELYLQGFGIVLFGGPDEKEKLDTLIKYPKSIINTAGKLKFNGEIDVMKQLNLMIAMDSSNMHLATLAGIPVVSIWGATHSNAGFGPLGDNHANKVEIHTNDLNCRPCSVYGNIECFRGDYACLQQISTEMVMERIKKVLR